MFLRRGPGVGPDPWGYVLASGPGVGPDPCGGVGTISRNPVVKCMVENCLFGGSCGGGLAEVAGAGLGAKILNIHMGM